ncbi:bifunctional metallophosphatase/5'-nucleotidase [Fluviibacterium sp. DFM31]|uniref:Bifunctional metallophosphatase/5'-nucleotidase n=1 Tax=Meridianimarinicoccus marinus TaxID=3231483 RepID=A0ABV3L2I1_9RHOB
MKRLFCLSAGAMLAAASAQADYALTILHTNDFHARFEPISKYDSSCGAEDNAEGKCFGGTARLASAIAEARDAAGNSILVDGGDQFQGTLFYTYYKGKVAAEMMNKLGYDAMTVGNHEFDDGPETLAAFVERVDFPVLMSNADYSAEALLSDKIMPSTVLEIGGEKIGMIGLTPQDNPEISSPGPNITFSDPSEAVQAQVDKLTAEGINKIVVLSHSGYDVDLRVAQETTGVDVIVGGHSNTYLSNTSDRAEGPYPTMVGDTAIVQAYAYGKFLGALEVNFDDAGNVVSAAGEPLIMDAEVPEIAEYVERIAMLAVPLDDIRNKVVAEAAAPIDGERSVCRTGECAMGNLVADAMLARVKDQGISIAYQNGGGVRSSIDGGEITMGEVYTVLPFQNTLSTFFVTGATIKDALENGMAQFDDPEKDGRFPQVAGMTFVINPDAPTGERISDIMVIENGTPTPLDPGKTYGVVSNNFVRNGGDGYAMFKSASDVYDFGPDLAEVMAEFLATNSPYQPYTDGRISYAK